ncbi:MAG: exodeoxyribonuclease VII large subunit [Candidatus Bipolaricaulis sp.]|nr:exodeoxyribonuclease VII large subunit [Candidatus Bipolaricaulis sp.]
MGTGEEHVYTISELNRTAREIVEGGLAGVWVKGEVSEISHASSGHMYFTLKDEAAEVSAVRFRSRSPILSAIEPGSVVLAFGKVTIYEPRGRYQFVATLVQPVGAGVLQAAFERLKHKLHAEGLFDPEHKKPIPLYPMRIGVVTSPTGAALHDIVSVLSRRWPIAELLLFPSSVQGDTASEELVAALDRAVRFSQGTASLDLILIGRGGGASEDLAPFNDERLARAVYASPIPVVSAVGHEIDFTITDFVADLRAATPTAAAELVTPDAADVAGRVTRCVDRARRALRGRLEANTLLLQASLRRPLFRTPSRLLETAEQRLDLQAVALARAPRRALERPCVRLARLDAMLRLSSPTRPLERGFSMTYVDGALRPLRDARSVVPGARITTRLAKGRLMSTVEEVHEE